MSDDRLAALLHDAMTDENGNNCPGNCEQIAAYIAARGVTLSSPDPLREAARELLGAIDSKAAIVAAGGVGFHNACAALRAAIAARLHRPRRSLRGDAMTLTVGTRVRFVAQYEQYAEFDGRTATIAQVIDTPDSEHDEEVLPMYGIVFDGPPSIPDEKDGEHWEAWPEELVPLTEAQP